MDQYTIDLLSYFYKCLSQKNLDAEDTIFYRGAIYAINSLDLMGKDSSYATKIMRASYLLKESASVIPEIKDTETSQGESSYALGDVYDAGSNS